MTASTPVDRQPAGRRMLIRLVAAVAGLMVVFAGLDAGLRLAVPSTGLLGQTVDIQTPATLYVKVDALRRFQGVKVVVLGDSLIFGRTMRDRGDQDWQEHTLSSQLERYLTNKYPGRPVMVSNLGMNGTLPVDLDRLARILLPLKPDLLVFDLTLRSFSRDFGDESDAQTRKWLRDLRIDPDGRIVTTANGGGIGPVARDVMLNYWYLYRIRDLVQSVAFDGEPASFTLGVRNSLDGWFKSGRAGDPPEDLDELDDIVLLMRARSRYTNIDLQPDNPQRQALDQMLQRISAARQPTVAFYATENPRLLPQLLPPSRFIELQRALAQVMVPADSPTFAFVGPLASLVPEDFIDHVHLNEGGYRKLVEEIGPLADQVLRAGGPR